MERNNENPWSMACHLTALTGYIIPFGGIFAPLIVWLLKKNTNPRIEKEGRKSLNFQITWLILGLALFLMIFFSMAILAVIRANFFLTILNFFLVAVMSGYFVAGIYFIIKNSILAFKNQPTIYPLSLEFIRQHEFHDEDPRPTLPDPQN